MIVQVIIELGGGEEEWGRNVNVENFRAGRLGCEVTSSREPPTSSPSRFSASANMSISRYIWSLVGYYSQERWEANLLLGRALNVYGDTRSLSQIYLNYLLKLCGIKYPPNLNKIIDWMIKNFKKIIKLLSQLLYHIF